MGTVALLLLLTGAFLIYEVARSASASTAAASSGGGGSTTPSAPATGQGSPTNLFAPPTQSGQPLAQGTLATMLNQAGLPVQQFLQIAERESGFNPLATCYAPGSDASKCTPYPKPGDTQAARGLFQFLDTTWTGYHCQGSPYNPADAIACAATAFRQRGFSDWGGPP